MFTLAQIQSAHSKVQSGSDFPTYFQELIALGVVAYETFVSDGHTLFYGLDNFSLRSDPKYPELIISEIGNAAHFKEFLWQHQQGQSNYMSFCKQSASCGIQYWKVDTVTKTCTYFDSHQNILHTESISLPS